VKGDITFYGQDAALEMLRKEKNETEEKEELDDLIIAALREWRELFKSEMYRLLDIEQNPQDYNG